MQSSLPGPFVRRAFAFLWTSLLLAQVDTATITGVVTDPSGASIVAAEIVAVNRATGLDYRASSNEAGVYVLTALPIGAYDLEVQSPGFQTLRRPNVVLNAGTRAKVDMEMTVGQVTEVVEVTAEVPLLESETSSLGGVVENKTITQMPLNGRNYQELAVLTAGVLPSRRQNFVDDAFSANGAGFDQNVFVLDGGDNNNYFSGVVVASNQAVKPSIDAIQEFKVETHNYGAEFGRGGGAVVQVSTRSGTNEFHGTLFEFLRNDKLDANNFFRNRSGTPKTPFRQNQFGATVGGPVIRDKVFFFSSYEGTRRRESITRESTIPTPAMTGGDFSGLGATIFDPATQSGDSGERQAFANNVIPQDRLDPVASQQIALYPTPNLTGNRNFSFNAPSNRDDDKIDLRVDGRINSNHSVFGRYSYLNFDRLEPGNLPLPASGGNTAVRFSRAHTGVVNWTAVIPGGAMVNELRVAYNRISGGIDTPTQEQLWKNFGFQGLFDREDINGLPVFRPAGYQNIGDRNFAPDPRKQDVRQVVEAFSWTKGKHAMKMGGSLRNFVRWSGITNFARGRFDFNSQFTRPVAGQAGGGGDAIADALLGLTSAGRISTPVDTRRHSWAHEYYFQDNFKVSPELTLNLGIRWEYQAPYVEQFDRVSNLVPTIGAPDFIIGPLDDTTEGRAYKKRDTNNFSPRIGFAYNVTPKTVIRGGFGIFYIADFVLSATQSVYANAPWYLESTIPTSSSASTSNIVVGQGFPADVLNPDTIAGRNLFAAHFPDDYPIGETYQWNINVQRQLAWNSMLSVAYVGSNTVHTQGNANLNQPEPGPGSVASRRWFPEFANVITRVPNYGANYQGLEMKFERRFDGGFSILSGYTFSKTLVRQQVMRTTVLAPEKTISTQHMPQRLFAAVVYDLPFGKGRKYATEGPMSHVLGGWQISPIVTFQSGLPFSPSVAGNPANTTGGQRPDRLRDGNLPSSERTVDRWFDVDAFAVPERFTFGNSAANVLEGPGFNNLNLMVSRTFRFNERLSLDFRTELFNLTNTPHFNFPIGTVNRNNGGTIGSTLVSDPGRQIQFGMKLIF